MIYSTKLTDLTDFDRIQNEASAYRHISKKIAENVFARNYKAKYGSDISVVATEPEIIARGKNGVANKWKRATLRVLIDGKPSLTQLAVDLIAPRDISRHFPLLYVLTNGKRSEAQLPPDSYQRRVRVADTYEGPYPIDGEPTRQDDAIADRVLRMVCKEMGWKQ
jgi:hypothetical protein